MTVVAILEEARNLGVTLRVEGDRIKAAGPRPAVERLLPALREHKAELLAELVSEDAVFDFAPRLDPVTEREALEERAAIIAEGCGMDYPQALQEAHWQAERERALRAFQRNVERILGAPVQDRLVLLARYHAKATAHYGASVARDMAATMRGWIETREHEQRG